MCVYVSQSVFSCPDIFIHKILKLRRHLGSETYDFVILNMKLQISIGNSMICSDILHKYHERYFEIVIRNFTSC